MLFYPANAAGLDFPGEAEEEDESAERGKREGLMA